MTSELYYIMRNGELVTQFEVQRSYYISTGHKHYLYYGEYVRWLNNLFGKSIKGYIANPSVEYLAMHDKKVRAVMQYRREHNYCSIDEAKKAVESIINDIKFSLIEEEYNNCVS